MKPTYEYIKENTTKDPNGEFYYGKTEGQYPNYYSWNCRPCWAGQLKFKVTVFIPGAAKSKLVASRANKENLIQIILDGIEKLENERRK